VGGIGVEEGVREDGYGARRCRRMCVCAVAVAVAFAVRELLGHGRRICDGLACCHSAVHQTVVEAAAWALANSSDAIGDADFDTRGGEQRRRRKRADGRLGRAKAATAAPGLGKRKRKGRRQRLAVDFDFSEMQYLDQSEELASQYGVRCFHFFFVAVLLCWQLHLVTLSLVGIADLGLGVKTRFECDFGEACTKVVPRTVS
jgi:hypothetical protein